MPYIVTETHVMQILLLFQHHRIFAKYVHNKARDITIDSSEFLFIPRGVKARAKTDEDEFIRTAQFTGIEARIFFENFNEFARTISPTEAIRLAR